MSMPPQPVKTAAERPVAATPEPSEPPVEHVGVRALRFVRPIAVLLIAVIAAFKYARFLDAFYPVREWLFWRIARLWLYCSWYTLACVSFGALVVRRALRVTERPVLETLVLSFGVGVVAFVQAMYLGGFLRLFNLPFACLLPTAMAVAGARDLFFYLREARAKTPPPSGPFGVTSLIRMAAWIFGLFGVALVYFEAFTPEALNFDATWCHLTVAQDYARAGRIVPFVADYARNHPQLASLVHTWGFLLPAPDEPSRWMLALHMEFLFFLWTLAGVAAAARWMLGDQPVRATWAAMFLFPAIFVYDSNIGGAADHVLAVFVPPLLLATGRALKRLDVASAALIGIFAAGALLTKYQGAYLLLPVAALLSSRWIYLLLHRVRATIASKARDPAALARGALRSPLLLSPLVLMVLGAVLTAPHFLRNYAFYGNPVYPFMQNVFRHSHPTMPDAALLVEYIHQDQKWRPHGTGWDKLKDSLELLYGHAFHPHYSFAKGLPYFGALFVLCIAIVPFLKKARRIWLGVAFGIGAVLAWALTFRVDRNLQPIVPIMAATVAAALVRAWELGWIARAGLVPLVAVQAIWGADAPFMSMGEARLRLMSSLKLAGDGIDGNRNDRFAYRSGYTALNQALPRNAKILSHGVKRTLGLRRDILLDMAGAQGLVDYRPLHNPRELYEMYRRLGVTHLLHNWGIHPAHTKQEDVLLADFLRHYATSSRRVVAADLIEMPPQPPPPMEEPYKVVTIGLYGYADGLYRVEQLNAFEYLPRELIRYPRRPTTSLPGDAAEIRELLHESQAVVVSLRRTLNPAVKAAIDEDFFVGESFARQFAVYLRILKRGNEQSTTPAEPRLGPDTELREQGGDEPPTLP